MLKALCKSLLSGAGFLLLMASSSCWAAADTLQPPQRLALVLGNEKYPHNPLRNADNDAALIQQTLQKLGFEVTFASDLNRQQMLTMTQTFAERIPAGAIALVYYAGHGLQVQGANYLAPIDMQPTGEQSVSLKAFPLQNLIDHLHAAPSAVNVVILDACRNNPFQPSTNQGYRYFADMGLARVVSPKGTIVAYSTAPGQFAEDGKGRSHSLYTETLAQQIQTPGLTIEAALKNVAEIIRKKTLDDQQPWYESSLVDSFYFLPPPGVNLLTQVTKPAPANQKTDQRGFTATPQNWYLSLTPPEWALLEDQLDNRVQYLTEDQIPLLEHRAEQGNAIAMTTLGLAYRNGFLQGRDEQGIAIKRGASNDKSLDWLEKAAEAGFPIAQRELGEMILRGIGTDADDVAGLQWLEKAANSGYPRAKIHYAQRRADFAPSADSQGAYLNSIFEQAQELNRQRIERIRQISGNRR